MNVSTATTRAARLHAAGVASSDNGRPATAARQLRAGLRLLEEVGGGSPAVSEIRGRLLVSLAWAESVRGRVDVGFRLLDEAEATLPPRQRPVVFAQRALMLRRTGHNELALAQYDLAVSTLDEQTDRIDLVRALNNRSVAHLDAGHVRLARLDLRRCQRIANQHGLSLQAAMSRVNLGCLDVVAGDLPAALRAFTAARGEYESLAPGRLPNLAVERARALLAAGLFTEADQELAYAVDGAARQRLSLTHAEALQARAEAALLADRPRAAAEWARQAHARFIALGNRRRAALASLLELRAGYAELIAAGIDDPGDGPGGDGTGGGDGPLIDRARRLSTRLRRLGLPEDARVAGMVAARGLARVGRVEQAERIATGLGVPGRVDRLDTRLLWRLTLAELANAAGRTVEATRHLAGGMATLHRYRGQLGCVDLQTGAAVHGRDLGRAGLGAAVHSGSTAAVYRWSERVRAQALLLPAVRPPAQALAATMLEELRQTRHALRAAELAGRPAGSLRSRALALQRAVRELHWSTPATAGSGEPAPAPLSDVKRALGDTALVSYLSDGRTLRALTVVAGTARLVTLGDYPAVEEAVLRLRADIDAQAGRTLSPRLSDTVAQATRRDAASVAAVVIAPLLPLIGDRDLVVVPTAALMTVPWAVLPGCVGRPVTVAPSATTWLAATRLAGQREPLPSATALLAAGPGNARGAAEIQSIADLRPHATVCTGADATPAVILGMLDRVDVAHLAAHGRHGAENALFSTLEFHSGPVFGYDLQAIRRAPRLVVLSSCELGLAAIRPGDETLGMVSALLRVHAATVVASVTRVGDDTAMMVMTSFHREIMAGCAPAAALARAMSSGVTAGFACFGAG